MPELIRSFAARVRKFFGDRRHAHRRHVRLSVSVAIQNPKTGEPLKNAGVLQGHTRDISPRGLAFIVPAIRTGEHYLTGDNRVLLITLQLPDIAMLVHATPSRYQRLDVEDGDNSAHYLIGARFTKMNDADRARLIEFLLKLPKR